MYLNQYIIDHQTYHRRIIIFKTDINNNTGDCQLYAGFTNQSVQ